MILGITGGLATGKSAVTRRLRELGALTFSADEAARAVVSPGSDTLTAIVGAFGPDVLLPDGTLDRTRLGRLVFAAPDARQTLNRLTHPPIRRLLRAQIAATRKDFSPEPLVVLEIPLLYEGNMQAWLEQIVVVSASETTQIARLRARNGLDELEARRRLQSQMPLSQKIALADDVLTNDGSPKALRQQVDALWQRLTAQTGY